MLVSEVLIGCAAGIGLAMFGYAMAHRLRKILYVRKQNKQRAQIVQEVMHAALAQRSNIRLEVMQGDFKGFSAEGIFNAVTGNDMILQITDAFGAHQWTHAPLILFLSIQQKGKTSFFHFTTAAFAAVRKGSFTELHMHLPDAVSPGQKRSFLRYTPPKTDVFGLGLWLMPGNAPLPTSRDGLDKPFLVYRPQAQNDMVLDNISAGGLRILIHERAMAQGAHLLEKDANLLFLVVLANAKKDAPEKIDTAAASQNTEQGQAQTQAQPQTQAQAQAQATQKQHAPEQNTKEQNNAEQEKSTVSFWISCRVAMRTHVEKNNLWQVAVRFENWSPVVENTKKIQWFPTDSNKSIPPLSAWVMRSHMLQTKKIA